MGLTHPNMVRQHNYYVYIVASVSKVLYVGVTNDLVRRVMQHRSGLLKGFTKRYNCKRLVYYEHFTDIRRAIKREKELKGWKRYRKIKLIEEINVEWSDNYETIITFSRIKPR